MAPLDTRPKSLVFGLFCALAGAACEAPAPPAMSVEVVVESDPGEPLADVAVALGGAEIARTDAAGGARLMLSGRAGALAEIAVRCPEGFNARELPVAVALRAALPGNAPPRYGVRCAPELRSLVVSVRSERGQGIPVRYLGQEIARIDESGVAHAVIRAAPGERVEVVLDTSAKAYAQLRPQQPALSVVVPDRDDIALFDQSFLVHSPKRRNPQRRRIERVGPVHF